VDEQEMRRRVAEARVARLATITSDGRPHLVPCCFALAPPTGSGSRAVVYSAVDAKPKSTLALRRLTNLRQEPRAALLVDHYSDDWSTLWWIRLDGDGRVLEAGPDHATPENDVREHEAAIALLAAKYPVYATDRPPGAVIAIDVVTWRAWP
jgi:PPOX class probable F420-dependent enzyme